MKIRLTILALVFFAYLGTALGQGCLLDMEPHYSSYGTVSGDSTHIYTSVVASGYADFTPSASCSGQGIIHTPKAYNLIGSTGGWGSGTGGCISCYLSYTNNQSIVAAKNTLYPFNFQGEIICSIAGVFFATQTLGNVILPNGACGSIVVAGNHLSPISCNNGSTTYHATVNLNPTSGPPIDSVLSTTSTDNVLVIDLLGKPYSAAVCPAGTVCRVNDFKAYDYLENPKGNINWNIQIWCGTSLTPDDDVTFRQPVSCQ
jgi:hypothetical protein